MTEGSSTRLSASEIERYSRQLCLPEVGVEGQIRLKDAKVLIVGLGGLGSPLAAYLTAAGVGMLGLVEHDRVATSNLQRQILYSSNDVDRPKVWAAKARLEALNPDIRIQGFEEALVASNAERLLSGFDVVADASDNFATRYLINDAAWSLGIPNVHASVYRFEGQLTVFAPGRGACYRCLYPDLAQEAPRCGDSGVLGVLPGILGTLQAAEVLKLILGQGDPLIGRLLMLDARRMQFTELAVPADPDCQGCSESASRARPERPLPMPEGDEDWEIGPEDLQTMGGATVLDVREGHVGQLLEVSDAGHALQARSLPLSRLAAELPNLDPAATYVAVCQYGDLSRHAVRILRGAGIRNAWSLTGGLQVVSRDRRGAR